MAAKFTVIQKDGEVDNLYADSVKDALEHLREKGGANMEMRIYRNMTCLAKLSSDQFGNFTAEVLGSTCYEPDSLVRTKHYAMYGFNGLGELLRLNADKYPEDTSEEHPDTSEIALLIRDAMCNFINNRGGIDGAASYVDETRGSYMNEEQKAQKTQQVIERIKMANKLRRISNEIAEIVAEGLNLIEDE